MSHSKTLIAFLLPLICLFVACNTQLKQATKAEQPPNIIFIFADDWGYGDLGCYGATEVATPNIDKLAEQGTKYTQFHVTSGVCSPSRSSVITGHFPARHRVHAHFAGNEVNAKRGMPNWLDESLPVYLPQQMQEAGYTTAHFGKWHLGGGGLPHGDLSAPEPKVYGYDETRVWNGNGPTWKGDQHFPTTRYMDSDSTWVHSSSRIAIDETIDFIKRKKDGTKPMFINLWLKDPHTPLWPTEEQKAPYKGMDPDKETYYAVLTDADYHIGRLMDALNEMNLDENTLVVFSSDNGPAGYGPSKVAGSTAGLKGRKVDIFQGGVNVPFIVRWTGRVAAGKVDKKSVLSAVDLLPTFCVLGGKALPANYQLDGENVSSIFDNIPFQRTKPLYWEWKSSIVNNENPNLAYRWPERAVRFGDYKLYVDEKEDRLELFNIPKDPLEESNIADQMPSQVKEMNGMWETWKATLPKSNKLGAQSSEDNTSRPKPNVVLILADDLGWQDVGCYDIDSPSPYETPNIDALAKEGVLFWQGYSPAPTCAPSRCAIMSGNHPARAQKTHVIGGTPPTSFNKSKNRMMPPWYSGRMPANEMTLARALQQNDYVTGHSGKWHMASGHHAFPQPEDQGFDYTRSNVGETQRTKPNRLADFSSDDPSDPFYLDENGFVFHQATEDALDFMRQEKDHPFFLYYAEWLVHTPIHTRNRRLLEKYVKKIGVDFPTNPKGWDLEGQQNPYYCAMVEAFDYHVGQVVHYLENTDDPRWPGHKLIENTYLIFTSDNGGMEGMPNEIITDNYPLDRGKISAMEGGTRVPFIIVGPDIPKDVQSDVMVNGLDFYPTILSWVGATKPKGKNFDGADLSTLLRKDPTDSKLVKNKNGTDRTTMMWHFPNSVALESTIRVGDYKLIRNYDHVQNPKSEPLELYRLYDSKTGKSKRADIEEAINLVESEPELTKKLNTKLTELLSEMKASYPYYNPAVESAIPNKEKVPRITNHSQKGNQVHFTFKENGAKVVNVNLIYTLNGGERYEEWFQTPATIISDTAVAATLPEGTTNYLINLIDENNFLVSYPEVMDMLTKKKKKANFSTHALEVQN